MSLVRDDPLQLQRCGVANLDAPVSQVLTEVRDAPRTLRIAAPIAATFVTVLYLLANVAYVSPNLEMHGAWLVSNRIKESRLTNAQFAAMSKSQLANSGLTVASQFFENVSSSPRARRLGAIQHSRGSYPLLTWL